MPDDIEVLDKNGLTQARINFINHLFKLQQTGSCLPVIAEDIPRQQVIDAIFDFQAFQIGVRRGDHPQSPDNLVFLASVAKVVITMLMLQDIGDVESLRCDKRIILELIGLSNKPDSDARFRYRLFELTGDQYTLNEAYRSFFESLVDSINSDNDFKQKVNKLLSGEAFTIESVDEILEGISNYLSMDGVEVYYKLSIDELVQLTLTLSSNATTQMFRELIGADRIQELARQALPHYHPTITTAGAFHWVQRDANIGRIEEFGTFLHELVSKSNKTNAEVAILRAIENNPNDFGFDFANSQFGQSLSEDGWSIYEKTGYYPLVNWVEDLANQGFPAHMCMCTVFSIVKDTQVFTFAVSMNIGISLGDDMVEEEITIDGQKVNFKFIDTESKEKSDYYKRIKNIAGEIFRDRLQDLVMEALQS